MQNRPRSADAVRNRTAVGFESPERFPEKVGGFPTRKGFAQSATQSRRRNTTPKGQARPIHHEIHGERAEAKNFLAAFPSELTHYAHRAA